MNIERDGCLLRVYIGELDKWKHGPLYEAVVLKAREFGMAGATVLRGPMGFGARSQLHSAKILRLSEDLPVVIEIVDDEEKIRAFLVVIEDMVADSLITMETVHVIRYRSGEN